MAVIEFGVSDAEFWEMCPDDFMALYLRWRDRHRWEEYLACLIKAGMWELKRDGKERPLPYIARDFMTSVVPQTEDDLRRRFQAAKPR